VEYLNDILRPYFGEDVYSKVGHLIPQFGFSDDVTDMIFNKFEGEINTGKLIRRLLHEV